MEIGHTVAVALMPDFNGLCIRIFDCRQAVRKKVGVML